MKSPSPYAPKTLGVIGFGRFGQLFARTMQGHFDVRAYDRAPLADEAALLGVEWADLATACSADVVVFAVPISEFDGVVRDSARWISQGQTVLDVCSVKVHPRNVFQEHLGGRGADLILTHPLFGPDSASGGWAGLPIALHNLRAAAEVFEWWSAFLAELGLRTIVATPEEHDRQAAYSQGLTHLVGRVLDGMQLEAGPVATTGFRALLEVRNQTCNDTWELFRDLQAYNPYTTEMRRDLMAQLESVSAVLDRESA